MCVAFAAIPAFGHVFPMAPLAQAAAEAGHEVTFACDVSFADRLPVPVVHGGEGQPRAARIGRRAIRGTEPEWAQSRAEAPSASDTHRGNCQGALTVTEYSAAIGGRVAAKVPSAAETVLTVPVTPPPAW